ncbi:unnamed protein product [Timema podura]|uniref:Uncharacterized protein n=1 Tax=Timema podura TaxID=61482 RepID=A0ABN7NBA6_TIMPD|nr:unnamed protein product [Timema podura]
MRFLDCREGSKKPSPSILDVGVANALDSSGFDEAMFRKRGGIYKWSKASMELDWKLQEDGGIVLEGRCGGFETEVVDRSEEGAESDQCGGPQLETMDHNPPGYLAVQGVGVGLMPLRDESLQKNNPILQDEDRERHPVGGPFDSEIASEPVAKCLGGREGVHPEVPLTYYHWDSLGPTSLRVRSVPTTRLGMLGDHTRALGSTGN